MTEVANNLTNSSDKINSLMKEAETLKQKLEEERQKLNDVTCKIIFSDFLRISKTSLMNVDRKKGLDFLIVYFLSSVDSVEHRRTIGNYKLHEYQAKANLERPSSKSFMFKLVA